MGSAVGSAVGAAVGSAVGSSVGVVLPHEHKTNANIKINAKIAIFMFFIITSGIFIVYLFYIKTRRLSTENPVWILSAAIFFYRRENGQSGPRCAEGEDGPQCQSRNDPVRGSQNGERYVRRAAEKYPA